VSLTYPERSFILLLSTVVTSRNLLVRSSTAEHLATTLEPPGDAATIQPAATQTSSHALTRTGVDVALPPAPVRVASSARSSPSAPDVLQASTHEADADHGASVRLEVSRPESLQRTS
jgi:hypothetical protein